MGILQNFTELKTTITILFRLSFNKNQFKLNNN